MAAGQGGRGRGWMVVYSPDKLCPACPSLFNSTAHEIAPRGSGWLEDLRRVRADLPRDQFFFLLGGCVAARRLLARGGCPAARGARRAAAAASSLFAQMPRARLTPSLARSPRLSLRFRRTRRAAALLPMCDVSRVFLDQGPASIIPAVATASIRLQSALGPGRQEPW